MKLFVVGDIHGRYDEFMKVLKYSKFNMNEDFLIATGDLIDRGPKSYEVVKWFKEMNRATNGRVQSVFGNHEHLLLSYISNHIKEEDYFNRFTGGDKTILSYTNNNVPEDEFIEHLNFLGNLPLCLEMGDFIITHAGYNINKPSDKQAITTTAWDSYGKGDFMFEKDFSGFDKTIIFGHTPTFIIREKLNQEKTYNVWRGENLIGVDCSFSKARKLCILDVLDDIEYYYDFSKKKCEKIVR